VHVSWSCDFPPSGYFGFSDEAANVSGQAFPFRAEELGNGSLAGEFTRAC
jgi:hypothetical protein